MVRPEKCSYEMKWAQLLVFFSFDMNREEKCSFVKMIQLYFVLPMLI